MKTHAIIALDLDGTLTAKNQFTLQPSSLKHVWNSLSKLGYLCVPVTGKPLSYAQEFMSRNGLKNNGILAENAGVYQDPQKNVHIHGSGTKAVQKLKDLLNIPKQHSGVINFTYNGQTHEIVVDPGDISIITFLSDHTAVAHRWVYTSTINAQNLCYLLKHAINYLKLESELEVLPPFSDGGVQVIRKDPKTLKAIDKSSLTTVLKKLYPQQNSVAMFGDGHNDIPAMKQPGVIPLTFSNADEVVQKYVKEKQGFVSAKESVTDDGILEGLRWLHTKGFFAEKENEVTQIIWPASSPQSSAS